MPAEKEFKMMPGTQSGPSYMAFARNGGMALGVKFIAIKEGAALGVADTTWIGARLRSAPEGACSRKRRARSSSCRSTLTRRPKPGQR